MNRIFGYLIGLGWLALAWGAFQRGAAGAEQGYTDMLVWWSVIAALLTIAALGALIGTTIHTSGERRS